MIQEIIGKKLKTSDGELKRRRRKRIQNRWHYGKPSNNSETTAKAIKVDMERTFQKP